MKFFEGGVSRLAASALTKDNPAYVQFYVTARCNLTCEQCNVIYANADQEEASLDECRRIAVNLAKIGTSVVLLTGGEPFARADIVEIAQVMIGNGVHPRLQTNGLASREKLERMVSIGALDISVSLDTLVPSLQDTINGDFDNSWTRAIKTIATINEIFPRHSFAALGCVLAPRNLEHIPSIIKFATEIGWWVSLVPAHTAARNEPRSFSTFDGALQFRPDQYPRIREILNEAKSLRDNGLNLYDSDEYLDDIYRFITGQPIQWRRRNGGVCDSPNLYFAIQPNGDMAVCCDYRLPQSLPVYADDFPEKYRDVQVRSQVKAIARRCSGCMYGSFPEISISMRYLRPMLHRASIFLTQSVKRDLKPLSSDEMTQLAYTLAAEADLL